MVSKLGSKITFSIVSLALGRNQWPRGLKRKSAVARLLGWQILIRSVHACLSVVSDVLLDRGVRDGPIALPEDSHRTCGLFSPVIKYTNKLLQLH
jgi:hypothetical protein